MKGFAGLVRSELVGVEGRGIPLACCLFITACASFLP